MTTTSTNTTVAPLPWRLEVDANDSPFVFTASHPRVAAGRVEFNVYNFGQDAHTFAIVHGTNLAGPHVGFVSGTSPAQLPAGQPDSAVTVDASLQPGTYTLFCTLYNHAALGMRTTITVG